MFFHAICTETVPNVTCHHFFDVFIAPNYFLITNILVATEEFFFCYAFLLFNWSWSYTFGLCLAALVLVLIL